MKINLSRSKLVPLAVTAALSTLPGLSHSSGFSLSEQNSSGLGNAYSGAAAAAEDASTIYFNPAGLSLLPAGKQISVSGHYIAPANSFNNSGSIGATGVQAGNFGGGGGVSALVPNAYFAMTLTPQWSMGVGLGVPFGLSTKYDSSWGGRFQAIESKIETININPTVAYKFSDAASVGFGVNYQTLDAKLTSNTDYAVLGAGTEGLATLKGKDSAWGWNVGAMFKLAPATRLGVAYRSRINYTLTGTAQFDNRPAALAAAIPDGNVKLNLTMPDNFSLALSHHINDRWQLLADATWTGWSVLERFLVTRTDNIPATGATLNNIPYNWKNTVRMGVGANHKFNDRWTLKMGLAYDESPTNNVDRGPRLPDGDRTWLSFGAKYSMSKAGTLDFGYAHIFVNNPSVNINAGGNLTNSTPRYALINGNYTSSVDILSASYTHSF